MYCELVGFFVSLDSFPEETVLNKLRDGLFCACKKTDKS